MFRRHRQEDTEGIEPTAMTRSSISNPESSAGSEIKKGDVRDSEIPIDHEKIVGDNVKFEASDDVEVIVDDLVGNDPTQENSPIEGVRAVVPNTDDPNMPVNTFRAWFLGILFVLIGSGVNEFVGFRYPRYDRTSSFLLRC